MNAIWQSMFLNGNKFRLSLVLNLSWLLCVSSMYAVAVELPSATLTPHTVYTNDFSNGAGPEWSDATTTTANGEKFLGANDGHGFGAGSTALTLDNLPDHQEVTVIFDVYIIGSWGGNGDGLNNNWQLSVDGNILLSTSFSNCAGLTQDYPNQVLGYGQGGTFEARTGAFENGHLGFGIECMGDTTYRLSYTFPHTVPTLALAFIGMEYQESGNKGWGLDNVRVEVKPAADVNVYYSDFNEDISEEYWSSSVGTLTVVEANDEIFIDSGAGTKTLTLTDLPPHSEVAVDADLYIINSWDGNGLVGNGPDNFQLTADATNLLSTNFTMNPKQTQAYPNQLPPYGAGGSFAAGVGAFEIGHLGEVLENMTYPLAYRFSHTEPTLELAFTSTQDQAAEDESWGLDNIQVDVLPANTLSVVKTGSGSGYVMSVPPGIYCGDDCSEDYQPNTIVTLTATASSCSRFVGWSGCPVVTGNTCKIIVTPYTTITARFDNVPDFVVTEIVVNPPTVLVNVPFTMKVTVKNQCLATGNAGRLSLWLNSPTALGCKATGANAAVIVGTLQVGQSKTYTLKNLTYTTTGNKITRTFIDADCVAQTESDKNNNQLTKLIIPGGPDFIVTSVAPYPNTPMVNSQFAARVMVKNQGQGPGTGGTLRIWANQPVAPGCKAVGDATVSIGAMDADASATHIVSGLNAGNPGSKTLRAFIDSDCTATEANIKVSNPEANNQLTKPYRVIGIPDLVITNMVLIPATPTANTDFVAKVIVKNQGTMTSGYNFLDVWLDQPEAQICGASSDAWASVTPLNPGDSTTITVTGLTAGAAGAKIMRAYVDGWCEISEPNETNNQFTVFYKL